ncbi:hypothetical protein AwErysi_07200 [Erysipelotrichaceae bacterium]|nr:hypothetical protein AwErysi_07200 [Erysipelotrichaceae bacterium]
MNKIKVIGLLVIVCILTPHFAVFANTEEEITDGKFNRIILAVSNAGESISNAVEQNINIREKSTEELIAEYYDGIDEITYNGYHDMRYLSEAQKIEMDYEIYLGEQKIRNNSKQQTNYNIGSSNWAHRVGNVLYTPESKSYNIVRHGHTAIISSKQNFVIEATTTATNGAKVFHWHYSNIWKKGNYKSVYELSPLFMEKGRQWVVNYALRQQHKPYGITQKNWLNGMWIPLAAESSWYCSKLIYMSYRHGAGYDLQASSRGVGEIHSSAYVVTPRMIYLSRLLGVYKYIGSGDIATYKN